MLIKRFRFLFRANGKIDVERGIRTLVAMAVSIVLGWIFQRQSEGLSIALFAQVIIIADVGNLYASRATTLIATTIGVALAFSVALAIAFAVAHAIAFPVALADAVAFAAFAVAHAITVAVAFAPLAILRGRSRKAVWVQPP